MSGTADVLTTPASGAELIGHPLNAELLPFEIAAQVPRWCPNAVCITKDSLRITRHDRTPVIDLVNEPISSLDLDTRGTGLPIISRQTVILIPAAEVLKKRVALPITSSRRLRKLVEYEVQRHSPVAVDQIHFDYRIVVRRSNSTKPCVELRMVTRAYLDRVFLASRHYGFEPALIRVAGDREPFRPRTVRFKRTAALALGWRRWNLLLLVLITVTLAAGTVVQDRSRRDLNTGRLAARVEASDALAKSVLNLRKQIEVRTVDAGFLEAKKRKALLLQVLRQLTRVVPKNAWVYEIQLDGSQGRLHGFSAAASDLLPVFEHSALFTHPQFRAPVVQGPAAGSERFDLGFDVKDRSP